jgi:hypothetical protein
VVVTLPEIEQAAPERGKLSGAFECLWSATHRESRSLSLFHRTTGQADKSVGQLTFSLAWPPASQRCAVVHGRHNDAFAS